MSNHETTANGDGRRVAAMQRLENAYQDYTNLVVVHYSCDIFGRTPEPATINHIVAKTLTDGAISLFDSRADSEKTALTAFARFVQQHPHARYLNWHMRNAQYGFEAINRRQVLLGASVATAPTTHRIDLARSLEEIYGHDYIGHPRWFKIVELNGITSEGWLSREAAAEAFAAGQHEPLLASTLRKVETIEALFIRAVRGELRTLTASSSPCTHSADFTEVLWYGARYTFDDGQQAKALGCLWQEFEKGGLGLSEKTIGEKIGSSSDNYRLVQAFRLKGKDKGRMHPAWGTMIQKVRQGVYRLAEPRHNPG